MWVVKCWAVFFNEECVASEDFFETEIDAIEFASIEEKCTIWSKVTIDESE